MEIEIIGFIYLWEAFLALLYKLKIKVSEIFVWNNLMAESSWQSNAWAY